MIEAMNPYLLVVVVLGFAGSFEDENENEEEDERASGCKLAPIGTRPASLPALDSFEWRWLRE